MIRRLLYLWACLLAVGAVSNARADTPFSFSFSVTGDPQCVQDGPATTCLTPLSAIQNVSVPPTGANIQLGTYQYPTTMGWSGSNTVGSWSASLHLTDTASGETKAVPVSGTLTLGTLYATAEVSPVTVQVGQTRYTITNGPLGDYGAQVPLYAHVMARPFDQPHPVFTTEPGGGRANEPLQPQPVVTVLNPDGSVATDYNGPVTLSVRPDTGNVDGYTLMGAKTVNAVNGVAAFSDIALSARGRYILTAVADGLSGVDSTWVNVLLPLGPDPPVLYRTTGHATFNWSSASSSGGHVTVTADSSGNVAAKPTGTGIGLARFDYSGFGSSRDGVAGIWTAELELTDEATGETVRSTIGGPFAHAGCCTAPLSPLTASVYPITVVVGGKRFTITAGDTSSAPWETDYRQYLSGIITYNPPDQPGLAFATQPSGSPDQLPLATQPVVVMRKPDGSTDTSFNGPVTLRLKPGAGKPGAVLLGTTTVNAVNGVATFTDIAVEPGWGYVLQASSGTWAGAESNPFNAGVIAAASSTFTLASYSNGTYPPPFTGTNAYVRTTTDFVGDVAASETGTTLTLVRFDFREGGASRYGYGGAWTVPVTLSDAGGAVTTNLSGTFDLAGCCTYPLPALDIAAHPETITLGGKRYTFTYESHGASPDVQYSTQYLTHRVTYNPPEQSALAFEVQPGGKVDSRALDPQPVVVMRKPDGSVDTSFNGLVTLAARPTTVPPGTSLDAEGHRTVTVNAVNGRAVFHGLVLSQDAASVVLTASSGTYAVADSQRFNVGINVTLLDAIRALKVAGGLEAEPSPAFNPPTIETAVTLARQAAGLG